MPIASYQDAFRVSYVVCTLSVSPAFRSTRQSGLVTVIDTSQDTAPAGSKYFACERKMRALRAPRVTFRSL